MRASRLAIVALLCLVGIAGIAVVAGAPPPTQLCGVCGSAVTDEAGVDGATGPGTLDIYVDESGDSHWQARVPVNSSAAERYRTNESALEAAVDDAWARYHAADGDVGTVESTMDGDTAVVTYAVDGLARRGVGDTGVVDYFATGTSPTRYELVAQRVTIHTPDGTTITNRVSGATVDDKTATWTSGTDRESGDDFGTQTYVTYGSNGGALDIGRGYATIGLAVGPSAISRGLALGIVPGAMIGVTGLAIGRGHRVRSIVDAVSDYTGLDDTASDAVRLERLLVAVGTAGGIGLLVFDAITTARALTPGAVVLASLGFGYALLGVTASRLGGRLETRGLTVLAAVATIVAAGFARLLAGPLMYPIPLLFGFATALCLPIGYAFGRGRTPIGLLAAVALVPSAVIALVYPMTSVNGWSLAIVLFICLPWTAVLGVFGAPLALMGRRLADG